MNATAGPEPRVEMLRPHGRSYRHLEMIWGTAVTIDIREVDERLPEDEFVRDAVEDAVEYMHWVDRVFSTYRPDTLVTALRTGRRSEADLSMRDGIEWAVLGVIEKCRAARELTDGAFDPWAVPGGFDPSGYVKGWAAEKVAGRLGRRGLANVCVNAGGDVVTRGLAGPAEPWRVGIRHPDDAHSVVRTVEPGDGAVATSGPYERGAHIVDPRTGKPARGARSASVIGPDAGLAEVLSTALVVAGRDGVEWFAGLDGWEAFVVDPLPLDTAWSVRGTS